MAEYLMRVERGEIKRLIVMMPPRHSKSETTTVKFPAWYLGRNPDKRVIIASHTAALALRFSMRARNDLAQFGPEVFSVGVDPNSSAMYRWDVLDREAPPGRPPGGMIAAGIGGPITGMGAHLAIIDDPVKGPEDANSQVQRDNVWDWYRFVLRTRLQPGAAVILVLTRWHEDDLAGRLLRAAEQDPTADQWTVLRLPAMAEENDPLGRAPGEALWPEQYDEAALAQIRASVGSYVWAALYQQRPLPAGGGVFKREWFRIVEPDRVPGDLFWVRFWDLATSTKTKADYTRGAKVALDADGNLWIGGIVGGRWEWPDARRVIVQTALLDGPGVPVGIEKVGFQGAAVQELLREPQLVAHTIVPVQVDRDKVQRAMPWAARAEAGKVFLVSGEWVGPFLDEVTAFPLGEHDDQVDAVSGAVQMLAELTAMGEPWDQYEPDPTWRG
ncbi:MAG: phage terminase large subunit [Bacillota bacterium]